MKNKDIKKHALNLLSDNWGQALAVVLVLFIIHVIFAAAEKSILNFLLYKDIIKSVDFAVILKNKYLIIATAARMLIGFVVITPAYIGAIWWYLRYVRGENNSIRSMFRCYSNGHIFMKTLGLKIVVKLIKLAALVPICGLVIVIERLIRRTMIHGSYNAFLVILIGSLGVLTICAGCFYILFLLRYALVDYIYVLNPDLKISEIIKISTAKMKDKKFEIIKLFLSFLWWLPSFVLVFPALFVIPYYAMAYTVMINNILEKDFTMEQMAYAGRRAPSAT